MPLNFLEKTNKFTIKFNTNINKINVNLMNLINLRVFKRIIKREEPIKF